jgi:hypothetical protein
LSRALQADRRRWLLGGLALAVVLVLGVVLLTGGSSDEPKVTVTDGPAEAGFPLRGDRARDGAAIRKAADAWLAYDARQDRRSRRLEHDEDVEMRALWAGRIQDSTFVILAERRNAVLLERESGGSFRFRDATQIRDDDDPGVVDLGSVILVDTKADAAFMPAAVRPPAVAPLDGLWATAGSDAAPSLPDGVLVLRTGMRVQAKQDRTAPVAVVRSFNGSTWLIDAALQAKLVPESQGGFSRPAYQRLVAATTVGNGDANLQRDPVFDPPKLRLVQDRPLPVLGPTMVLTSESRSGRDRVLAAHGGSSVGGKDEAERLVLGDGTRGDNAARAEDGLAFAAGIVDRGTREQPFRGLSVFVAGSSEIETIEVLTGRRRLTRPGPVAVVPVPGASDLRAGERARPGGDLAVLGRTRAGTVVVPSAVIDG